MRWKSKRLPKAHPLKNSDSRSLMNATMLLLQSALEGEPPGEPWMEDGSPGGSPSKFIHQPSHPLNRRP